MLKPGHEGGYTPQHAELCERTLVTLLRGLGPYKQGVYVIGGLVPRYLIPRDPDGGRPPHAGTTDVDLVLDVGVLATIEAYRRLEANLKAMGFERGRNDEGQAQHHSWRKRVTDRVTVVVDLLCDAPAGTRAQITDLPGEKRLKALGIPGAHLAVEDHVVVELTAERLDDGGLTTEVVRVAGVVPFIVLKALAYEDRAERKDAYDLIYCLMHYGDGPTGVAAAFRERLAGPSPDPLIARAIEILRSRFASDPDKHGHRKDGPTDYARFRTDPGQPDLDARHRATPRMWSSSSWPPSGSRSARCHQTSHKRAGCRCVRRLLTPDPCGSHLRASRAGAATGRVAAPRAVAARRSRALEDDRARRVRRPGRQLRGRVLPGARGRVGGWWPDAMDRAHGRHFADLAVTVPCCGAATSLNDLRYDWPAGFARFVLEATNPGVPELPDAALAELERRLGAPLRVVRAHY